MIGSITKDESGKADDLPALSNSVASRLRMFNNQINKKQSIIVGSSNQKNIHSSNINSYTLVKSQLITSDLSGFIKVWKL